MNLNNILIKDIVQRSFLVCISYVAYLLDHVESHRHLNLFSLFLDVLPLLTALGDCSHKFIHRSGLHTRQLVTDFLLDFSENRKYDKQSLLLAWIHESRIAIFRKANIKCLCYNMLRDEALTCYSKCYSSTDDADTLCWLLSKIPISNSYVLLHCNEGC